MNTALPQDSEKGSAIPEFLNQLSRYKAWVLVAGLISMLLGVLYMDFTPRMTQVLLLSRPDLGVIDSYVLEDVLRSPKFKKDYFQSIGISDSAAKDMHIDLKISGLGAAWYRFDVAVDGPDPDLLQRSLEGFPSILKERVQSLSNVPTRLQVRVLDEPELESKNLLLILRNALICFFTILGLMAGYLAVKLRCFPEIWAPRFWLKQMNGYSTPSNESFGNRLTIFLLGIALVSFFIFPKFQAGIPMRIEDLIFLILLPLGIRYITKPKSLLFYLLLGYISTNFVAYGVHLLSGTYNLGIRPIMLLKEIQFLYFAYLLYYYRSQGLFRLIDVMALINILYGVFSILTFRIAYYGIGTIGNPEPSNSGAMYAFVAIWLHIRSEDIQSMKGFPYRALCILGTVCCIATVSRTYVFGIVSYFAVYYFMRSFKKVITLGLTILILSQGVLLFSPGIVEENEQIARLVSRVSSVEKAAIHRYRKWQSQLAMTDGIEKIFGTGRGSGQESMSLAMDSQYVRGIVENGFLGTGLLWGGFFSIWLISSKRRLVFYHTSALLCMVIVICFPAETLLVSKSGTLIWLLLFYLQTHVFDLPPSNKESEPELRLAN